MNLLFNRASARLILLAVSALFAVLACNFPGRQPQSDTLATSAAETVAAQLTEAASLPTVPPVGDTATPLPQPSATPIPSITPTPTPDCTNDVGFVSDISVPDDTVMEPGETFDKTWRLRNDGTCTWDPDYDLVFDSGNIMAGPPSSPIPGFVAPGATIDVTVPLTAPNSDGTHRGDWLLRSPEGLTFGLGPQSDSPFYVRIVVGDKVGIVLNMATDYCDAEWRTGAGVLSCPGSEGDAEGYVIRLDAPKLENGVTENERGLVTHPETVDDGVISGRYPLFEIQDGDHFRAVIACEQSAVNCDVRFQLNYVEPGESVQPLGEWNQVHDGTIFSLDVDLSSLDGKSVHLVLAVVANGPSIDDAAVWLVPRVVGNLR